MVAGSVGMDTRTHACYQTMCYSGHVREFEVFAFPASYRDSNVDLVSSVSLMAVIMVQYPSQCQQMK